METLIVYNHKNGLNKKFAEEIAKRVRKVTGRVNLKSMENTNPEEVYSADLLFLGCQTDITFLGQKPDKDWVNFVNGLPEFPGKSTVLFTTYKIGIGQMFRRMKQFITPKGYRIVGSMKSNNGEIDYYSIAALKFALNYKALEVERNILQLAEVS